MSLQANVTGQSQVTGHNSPACSRTVTALPPLSARILALGEDDEPTMAMAGDFHFGESGFSHAVRALQESDPCPPMRATPCPGTADPAGPRFKVMDLESGPGWVRAWGWVRGFLGLPFSGREKEEHLCFLCGMFLGADYFLVWLIEKPSTF